MSFRVNLTPKNRVSENASTDPTKLILVVQACDVYLSLPKKEATEPASDGRTNQAEYEARHAVRPGGRRIGKVAQQVREGAAQARAQGPADSTSAKSRPSLPMPQRFSVNPSPGQSSL